MSGSFDGTKVDFHRHCHIAVGERLSKGLSRLTLGEHADVFTEELFEVLDRLVGYQILDDADR